MRRLPTDCAMACRRAPFSGWPGKVWCWYAGEVTMADRWFGQFGVIEPAPIPPLGKRMASRSSPEFPAEVQKRTTF